VPPERKSQPRNQELAALGKAIEQQMAAKGLSQKAVADASGIDIRRVGDYVRGQYNPSVPNVRRLCKALDLSVTELMDRAADLEEEPSEH
jgi:transcriptional regulator with XRE-family HTH domain